MWGSSSGYIGSSSDPSGSISNIAQYIEDYIDLVENIPNDIARCVSRLHEYNNRYYQLLDKLEKTWESIAHCSNSILLSNGGGDQLNGGGNTSSLSSTSFSSTLPTTTSLSTTLSHPSLNKTEIKSSTNIKSNHTSSTTPTSTSSTTPASSSLTNKSNCNFNLTHEIGSKCDKNSGNGSGSAIDFTPESRKGLKAVVGLQKCLIEIQEISDEKLFIVQSILDQLDCKARQLDYDHRSVTIGTLANNLNSASSKGLSSLIGASSDTTNHVSDANGLSNNLDSGGGGKGGGEITSTKDNLNSNGTNLSATVNNCNALSSKRSSSRRNLSSKQEISNGEITSHHKRGVKRGGGVKGSSKDMKRNKSAKEVLNASPPTLYEDTPIDPDEPTYCSCEQVSYGEMICCDNAQCPIEWFHFACVSLTTKPKGKWYCPNCRGDRSNIPKK